MSVLNNSDILKKMNDREDKLIISPILDTEQLGPASIDLRIGTEFKVAINSREPVFGVIEKELEPFYQTTYRNFGESIFIYPNQQVLADTFEYVRIPQTCIGQLFSRSSLIRVGLSSSSIVQPGYTGTLTVSLENMGNTALEIKSGMRIFQLILFNLSSGEGSFSYTDVSESKYIGNTGPVVSSINDDKDLDILKVF